MDNVLVTAHLIIVLFLIVVVLLQRSEGGGLGIGGGGGGGMTRSRSSGDGLTRTTAILAAAFFVTSLGLGILARYSDDTGGLIDRIERIDADSNVGGGDGILDELGPAPEAPPAAPATDEGGVPTGN